jgi:A/G-specific adenine glycosylase
VAVAEILLRRTRAEAVAPVYTMFIRKFPDPLALAHARAADIFELLRPLGLRWRAANLVAIARRLRKTGGNPFGDPVLLRGLPGVGDYVASAVAVFALGRAAPVVDANTARVAGRFFGITTRSELRRSRAVREALGNLVGSRRAREVNLALIDLGALLCRPALPRCPECPLEPDCMKAGVRRWR